MKIAIVTAGGAGMFCGSCMQDNTLARTLRQGGADAVLVPTYTPIRVDEEDVSVDRVFLGGVNVYLDTRVPGWKRLPGWITGWLNRPSLIRWLSRFGNNTEAAGLGALTLDMLHGIAGPQQREIHQFCDYLCSELQPDVIVFSNALLSGVLSELRPRFSGTILCLLQGDDIFLESLNAKWKQPVLDQLKTNCERFDGFLTHSRFYREFMTAYLNLPSDRFRQIPLTIDTIEHLPPQDVDRTAPRTHANRRFRIGYFARICPEKGVQNLLQAAVHVLPGFPHAEIAIAGYLAEQHRKWFEGLLAEARDKVPGQIHWLGSPADRSEKFRIIRGFNALCVPTNYYEPKGLYVLEAGLCGVPSVLPRHGAFPELVAALAHGWLYDAAAEDGLCSALQRCIEENLPPSAKLAETVRNNFGMQATTTVVQQAIDSFTE